MIPPIILKTPTQVNQIREINKLNCDLLEEIYDSILIGTQTIELDNIVLSFCNKYNVIPAFKNYQGFPFCLCISINDEVVHGFPSQRVIDDGDIVSVDCGLVKDGYYSDAAFTKIIGNVNDNIKLLVETTKKALLCGISKAMPGNRLYDIGHAIHVVALNNGFDVVKEFVGHGVGFNLHEEPKIPNYVGHSTNLLLREGMIVAIEPMILECSDKVFVDDNKWTVKTCDGGFAAHFERTIFIGREGPEILGRL